jgi:uncharacterized protein YybS (DUF2232 family)
MPVSAFSTPAVTEAGKAVALAVVLAMAASYLPLVSLPLMTLMPLPLAFLVLRRGAAVGIAAAFGTGVLTLLLTMPVGGIANGVLALSLAGVVGVALGLALRRQWEFSLTLLVGSLAAAVSLAASSAVIWVLTGLSQARLERSFDQSLASVKQVYAAMGVTQASLDLMTEQARAVLRVMPYLLPSMFAVSGLLLVTVSLALAGSIFPRAGQAIPSNLSFARFRVHWSLAYGLIGGLALVVLARGFGPARETALLVGANLLIVFGTLYFLEGLALIHWFSVSRRLSGGTRVLLYGGALVAQFLLWVLSWVGLLDTWFDYRKRFAPREDSPSPPPTGREDRGDPEEW